MLSAGVQAPGFTLSALSGERVSLASLTAAGPVLLAFFKISCPVCQLTLPFLERMAGGGLNMVAISQDDAADTEEFRSAFGVTFTTLLDQESAGYPVSNAYGITHVPTLFLVEPDGRISMASTGFAKADLEALGMRAGVVPFRADEAVPAWKAG